MSTLDFKDLLVGLTYVERLDDLDIVDGPDEASTEVICEGAHPACLLVKIYVPATLADEIIASIPNQ